MASGNLRPWRGSWLQGGSLQGLRPYGAGGGGGLAPDHTCWTPAGSPSGLETELQSPGQEVTFGRSRGHWGSDGLWSPCSSWPGLVLQSFISVFNLVARQDLKHFTKMNKM